MSTERMKYLGALNVLAECAVYVPEEMRETIERVLEEACSDGRLKWRRILDRMEIEVNVDHYQKGASND